MFRAFKCLPFFVTFFVGAACCAQDPVFLLNEENLMTVNPASAGLMEGMRVDEALMLNQFLDQSIASTAWNMRMDSSQWGIGVLHCRDGIGNLRLNTVSLALSHGMEFQSGVELRWGLNIEMVRTRILNDFIAIDPNDPAVPSAGSLTEESNLGFGVLCRSGLWRFGLAGWHVLDLPTWYTESPVGASKSTQVNGHVSTTLPLVARNNEVVLSIRPHALIAATDQEMQLWTGFDLDAFGRFRVGAKWSGLRETDIKTLAMNAGILWGRVRLDYAYGGLFNESLSNQGLSIRTHNLNASISIASCNP